MKERPIIICTQLIPPTLDGRKTQTRRTRNLDTVNKELGNFTFLNITKFPLIEGLYRFMKISKGTDYLVRCPYGQVGDRLWVREIFQDGYAIGGCKDNDINKTINVIYKVTEKSDVRDLKWKSSIYMPRWASRVTLEITDIRVERLRDMTTEGAIAEGMTPELAVKLLEGKNYLPYCIMVGGMKMLWNSLAKKGFEWENNPWVWVIDFKQLKRG